MTDKIVFGVDLDECVFGYIDALRKWLKDNFSYEVPAGEPISYSMVESGWFKTVDEFRHYHGLAVEDGLFEKMGVLSGASEVMWELSNSGYELNIITSRFVNSGQHEKVVSQTVRMLERNNIPYSNISFLSNKVLQFANVYLDDSPHNITGLSSADRFVIIRDMEYNRHLNGVRAKSWYEVRNILRHTFGQ